MQNMKICRICSQSECHEVESPIQKFGLVTECVPQYTDYRLAFSLFFPRHPGPTQRSNRCPHCDWALVWCNSPFFQQVAKLFATSLLDLYIRWGKIRRMVPFIPPFMNVQVVTFCMVILGRFEDVVCILNEMRI